MSRFALRRDEGLTLLELMVASLVTVVVGALMVTWLVAVTRSDVFQEQDLGVLDDLRVAKGRLIKEMRFAESIGTADPHLVKFYADFDRDGMQTSDEFVTWEIQSDGALVRFTDAAPTTKVTQAEDLVYDAGAAAGSSRFLYGSPDNNPVTIEFVADADASLGPEARSIQTQVYLRN